MHSAWYWIFNGSNLSRGEIFEGLVQTVDGKSTTCIAGECLVWKGKAGSKYIEGCVKRCESLVRIDMREKQSDKSSGLQEKQEEKKRKREGKEKRRGKWGLIKNESTSEKKKNRIKVSSEEIWNSVRQIYGSVGSKIIGVACEARCTVANVRTRPLKSKAFR